MFNVSKFIEALGGISKASKLLGIPISTLQYWIENNQIPLRQIDYVQKMAERNGIVFNPASNDNFEPLDAA